MRESSDLRRQALLRAICSPRSSETTPAGHQSHPESTLKITHNKLIPNLQNQNLPLWVQRDSDSSGPWLYLAAIHPFHFLLPNLLWLPSAYGIKFRMPFLVFRALPPSSFSPTALSIQVITQTPACHRAFAQGKPSLLRIFCKRTWSQTDERSNLDFFPLPSLGPQASHFTSLSLNLPHS